MNITATIGALLLGLAFAAQAHADTSPTATLDAFYAASAGSNQSAFIAQLTEDAVLLGVDGGERLQGEALRDYVSKSFGSESATATNGNSWGYHSSDRHIRLSADGTVAWFDESLQHEQLGAGRASGVLVANGGNWKIAQYNRIAYHCQVLRWHRLRVRPHPQPQPQLQYQRRARRSRDVCNCVTRQTQKAAVEWWCVVRTSARPDQRYFSKFITTFHHSLGNSARHRYSNRASLG
jgi:hypothetical protein